MTAENQLAEDLAMIAFNTSGLFGLDLHPILTARVDSLASLLISELRTDETAISAATTIMHALHGTHDPDPDWWRSPLGRLCANALAEESAEAITHQAAADMLGLARGTIAAMVHRGTLDRHPDGGVLRSSVLARLGRSRSDA